MKTGVEIKAHADFLKLFFQKEDDEDSITRLFHRRTEINTEAEMNEWVVEKF